MNVLTNNTVSLKRYTTEPADVPANSYSCLWITDACINVNIQTPTEYPDGFQLIIKNSTANNVNINIPNAITYILGTAHILTLITKNDEWIIISDFTSNI